MATAAEGTPLVAMSKEKHGDENEKRRSTKEQEVLVCIS
jgi:hypothetical protein